MTEFFNLKSYELSSIIHYHLCPVCGSTQIEHFLKATDHTVSGKVFSIWKCHTCLVMFTQDVPDEQSIGAYYKSQNYISHTDTDQGLVNRLYHLVRKRTLGQKQALVEKVTGRKTGSLLDIGAGTGAFAHQMKQAGWSVTGLEPDQAAVHRARELYNVSLLPSSQLFELPNDNFDAITMWHVLEHVHELHRYAAKISELLKPSGNLVVAVPNYTSFDATAYQQYWAAYDVPRHLYHFAPLSIKILFEKHGFILDKIRPMWFDSFYVSLLSEEYRNGRQNLVSGFMHGLKSNLKAVSDRKRGSSLIYILRKR